MQRSLSVLFLACAGPLLPAQGDSTFVREFGSDGARGGYRLKFDDAGAGLVYAMTLDHYVTAAARDKPVHGPADWMLLVWGGGDYAFRVGELANGDRLFAQDLWTARWQRKEEADGAITFAIVSDGLRLEKTFRHRPDQRGLSLELRVVNEEYTPKDRQQLRLQLLGPTLVARADVGLIGTQAFALAQPAGGAPVHHAPDAEMHELLALGGQELAMAGTTNRFFGGFLFPLDDGARHAVQTVTMQSLPVVEDPSLQIRARTMPRVELALQLPVPARGSATVATFGVYLGPKSLHVFGESDEHQRFLPVMDVDLEPPCCGSIVVPGGRYMATMLVKLLGWFHSVVGEWGIAIMLLTILVRGCLAPLNFRMQKSMRAFGKRMAVLKPKMDALKARYADDPKAYQQAMLQFNREHKLMPPLGGCLPIFLTMPIYVGLFTALRTAYDLRQERFLFMHDLSLPDTLFELPFWPHSFNIMPLLWLTLMIVLQLRMPLPTDPQQRQMQQMMRFMPLIFGVLLYNYASGLLVYMVTSMLWTFVESAITKKILGPIDPNAAAMAPPPVM
jgi:YidC/Oxa1 family membrane protein insertase